MTLQAPVHRTANHRPSLLDELRTRYEAACASTHADGEIEGFEAIDARLRKALDYRTGIVAVTLINVDRLERVSLEFQSSAIDEPALEDLVLLVLGRGSAFLRRAPLAGLRRRRVAVGQGPRAMEPGSERA